MRDAEIQAFLDLCAAELDRCTGPAAKAAEKAVRLWHTPAPATAPAKGLAASLPVVAQIPPPQTSLARAFAPLIPRLCWARRGSARPGEAWYEAHANAMVLGPGGLEPREDIWVGATVMAPGTLYPNHSHPPEEIYLPLTAGEWWNAGRDWHDPGLDGFVYNPPGILHAMRAGAEPFVAIWILPV